MDQWYCRDGRRELGPLYSDEIQFLVRSGSISHTATVRKSDSDHWVELLDTDFRSAMVKIERKRKTISPHETSQAERSLQDATESNSSSPAANSALQTKPTLSTTGVPDDYRARMIPAVVAVAFFLLLMAFLWLLSETKIQPFGKGDDGESGVAGELTSSDRRASHSELGEDSQTNPVRDSNLDESSAIEMVDKTATPSPVSPVSEETDQTDLSTNLASTDLVLPATIREINLPKNKAQNPEPGSAAIPAIADLKSSDLSARTGESREAAVKASGGSVESERAVARALDWLRRLQQSNGSWDFQKVGASAKPGDLRSNAGATALAALCFLGAGNTTKSGPDKEVVRRAFRFLETVDSLAQGRQETMYVHALVAMCFSELAAMEPDEQFAVDRSTLMLKFIEDAQDPRGGGWRYNPREAGDLSVTGWQIMALQSAQTAGLSVSETTVNRAEKFMDSVSARDGSEYGYTPGSPTSQCMTAVGLLSRVYLGWSRESLPLQEGIDRLDEWGPDQADVYYNYYATLTMHHFGGDPWDRWNERMRESLIETQIKNGPAAGSWKVTDPHGQPGGQIYQTCLSVLCLEVYYRYLPMFDDTNKP